MGDGTVTAEATLRINEIYHTIQGEGRYAGTPMVIVRLHGCGVGCPFCDTKQTWEHGRGEDSRDDWRELNNGQGTPTWMDLSVSTLADIVTAIAPRCSWVMLTGGEPLEQQVRPFLAVLPERYGVVIETSGTACADETLPLSSRIWLCVSPKVGMPGGKKLDESVMRAADEWKFVIGKGADLELVQKCLDKYDGHRQISLQPMSTGEKATAICVGECLAKGYHLSLQQHKFMGMS